MTARARVRDDLQLGFGFDAPASGETALQVSEGALAGMQDAAREGARPGRLALVPDETPALDDDLAEQEAEDRADAERAADRLLARLRGLGLQHVHRVVLTRNRSILVSVKGFELRVHEGFCEAPEAIQVQIVRFVMARRKWERQAARDAIVAHPLPRHTKPPRAPERTHPDDEPLAERLAEWHTRLNGERFGAQLGLVPIRISRRMARRLGHYAPGVEGGGAEIAISARHCRRDGFAAALDTLLHEMVHQWQHENGLPLDHGAAFRRKCREVGAVPSAKRTVR